MRGVRAGLQARATLFQAEPLCVSRAIQLVRDSGKAQMAPYAEPRDAFIFGSFIASQYDGEPLYLTILYFDRRQATRWPLR